LSLPGIAALGAALFVLVRSLSARNAYEIILSSGALALWMILGGAGLWGARRLAALEPGWKPPLPLGAEGEEETLVQGLGQRIPWFFRIHFIVSGRFFPAGDEGGGGCAVRAETSAPRGGDAARLFLSFPLSGVFRGEGSCRLRDLFGFFSFPCGIPQERTVMVRSAPPGRKDFRVDAQSGAEDRRNKSSSDEERYYMREYAPGDRFRDINWKSSERIDTLITRISPDNQEKVSRIEVYFRNYGPVPRAGGRRRGPSLGELWLLDRAKARLAWFLRAVKDEQAAYVFVLRTAQGSREIREEDELEVFFEELAGLPFSPPRNEDPPSPGAGELYVFSTACDPGLPAFLVAAQPRPLTLFMVQPAPGGKGAAGEPQQGKTLTLRLRDFWKRGLRPPLRWLFPAPPGAGPGGALGGSGGGRVLIDYAEARL
jgi:hypothetical protein